MAKRPEPLGLSPAQRGAALRRPKPEPASSVEPAGAAPAADPARQVAFRLGLSAESRAAAYMIAKGFRILVRRWRGPGGEIDIIARRRNLLVFVEVKARATLDGAAESVTPRQRQRIVASAEAWLAAHPDPSVTDMRFDAVLVAPGRIPVHIPGAFDADG